MKANLLHVVVCVNNPRRFKSRYRLYKDFERRVLDAGAHLWTVECAFGDRPYEITQSDKPQHIQLRTGHELWHKENLLNIGISRLPHDWQYVAWLDTDVMFARADWAEEAVHQLQHYDVIQLFSEAVDLGPNYEFVTRHNGFIYSYLHNLPFTQTYSNWHSGYAWAARRSALNHVGGLIDTSILGAGDRHMAAGLIGKVSSSLPKTAPPGYVAPIRQWEARAMKHIKGNVGYMPGLLLHHWHGKKVNRGYKSRWKILADEHFDPALDLKRDTQGVWQLTDRNPSLRDKIRQYFQSRNEDSIDLI